ncbi:FMRFamide receptor-like [Lingula anatina]|uniref:FMRFamide receptor-like n=1 Tax=Lingula anatina TaxID=7574 RepID=A0A1S3H466_LINAN|nr:FMRFamide receptor-like [Lingula anatina]|eukprot:XP_013380798.1 FMRFamide receptor-like [Lingula anatina]
MENLTEHVTTALANVTASFLGEIATTIVDQLDDTTWEMTTTQGGSGSGGFWAAVERFPNGTHRGRVAGNLNFFNFIMLSCISSVVCLVGICGNTLAFLVFLREKKKGPSSIILQALAVSDNLILINTLVEFSFAFFYPHTGLLEDYFFAHRQFSLYTYPLHYIFITSSTWLLVLLTIHRYIAVCKPLHAKKMSSVKHARIQAAGVFLFSIAFNMPKFFDVKDVGITYLTSYNDDMSYKTVLQKNFALKISYRIVLTTLVMYIIPIGAMAIMNGKLISKLRESKKQRLAMGKTSTDRDSINHILVAVVIIFMCCTTPIFFSQIVMSFVDFLPRNVLMNYFYFIPFLFLLVAVNAALNFFVYTLIGQKFRSGLREMICSTCATEEQTNATVKSSNNRESTMSNKSDEADNQVATVATTEVKCEMSTLSTSASSTSPLV